MLRVVLLHRAFHSPLCLYAELVGRCQVMPVDLVTSASMHRHVQCTISPSLISSSDLTHSVGPPTLSFLLLFIAWVSWPSYNVPCKTMLLIIPSWSSTDLTAFHRIVLLVLHLCCIAKPIPYVRCIIVHYYLYNLLPDLVAPAVINVNTTRHDSLVNCSEAEKS